MKGKRTTHQMRLVLTEKKVGRAKPSWALDPETRSRGLAGVAEARERLRRAS